jgi:hypothetical protein
MVVVAACGAEQPQTATGVAKAGAASSTPSADATAAEVAQEARGDLRCPARVAPPARDPRAAVNDVVGVRPGMSYEDAVNVVLCTHELMVVQPDGSRGFPLQTYGQTIRQGFSARFAEPRVAKTSRQIMQEMQDEVIARSGNAVREDMRPGQSKWYVGTMGMPGEERVISVAREEWFEEGRNPTVASVEQALLAKYGAATQKQQWGNDGRMLTWGYDPMGRPITETSPRFHQCSGVADPDGGANFSPDCGVVVMAIVQPLQDNPQLSRLLQVGVVDQAGGYEALAATERSLQALEDQRRATQVQAAASNADAPEL